MPFTKTARGTIKVGPGTIEEILMKGLRDAGLIPDNATNQCLSFQRKNKLGKQVKVQPNLAVVAYIVKEEYEGEAEEPIV